MSKPVVNWDDETRQLCADVEQAETFMNLLGTLSEGCSSLRLAEMRDAVAVGNFDRAARLEAEAQAWEQVPELIRELASEWRKRAKKGT